MIEIRIFDGHLEHDIKVMCLDMALLIAKNGNKNVKMSCMLNIEIPEFQPTRENTHDIREQNFQGAMPRNYIFSFEWGREYN